MPTTPTPNVRETAANLYAQFENRGIDAAVRDWGAEVVQQYQSEIDLVVRGDEGYEEFLLEHVQGELRLLRADPEDLPDDVEPREKPVCTCGDVGCDLKRGRLPKRVRDADDLQRGIEQFRREHPGDPLVLTTGREAWSDLRGRVYRVLRFVLAWMDERRDHPPSADEVTIAMDVPTVDETETETETPEAAD
jgi:hypothetical protein